jgi:hypothetical protein
MVWHAAPLIMAELCAYSPSWISTVQMLTKMKKATDATLDSGKMKGNRWYGRPCA